MLMGLLVYLLITGYICTVYYYFLSKKYSGSYSFGDRLLGTFVLGISQIILTEMILGFTLKLDSLNLFIFNLLISSCMLLLSGVQRTEIARQFREALSYTISFLRLIIRSKVLLSIFVLAFLQVTWWAFLVYLFPPYAWDELFYHLPKMAYVIQSGGIKVFQTTDVFVNQFPFNSELLFLWNVIYPRNDILVNGTQIVFALFSVLAIYNLARKAGAQQQNAAWAVIFLFIPIVIQQATTCYIDIIMSSLLIGAVNFMLVRDRSKTNILIVGMTIGIILGSKYSYIGPCLVVSLAFWGLILAGRRENARANKSGLLSGKIAVEIAGKIAIYLIPVLMLGGTWYVRNYLLFGNPVAPYQIEIFGRILFPGAINPATDFTNNPTITWLFQPVTIFQVWLEKWAPIWGGPYYCYDGSRGFGPMFWILLIPSGIFAIIIACMRRYWDFMVAFIVFGLCFSVIPWDWLSRYTIFVCGFGILSFIIVLEYLKQAKVVSLVALPIIVLTLVQGNFQFYLTPRVIADFVQHRMEQRHIWDIAFINNYSEMYQVVLKDQQATILYTSVPYDFTYPLWDAGFNNTILAIPGKYSSAMSFVDSIRSYGACYIIATEDSDIVKYFKIGEAKINLRHMSNYVWVFFYPGGDNDNKKD